MVSGVSLKGARASLVLLGRTGVARYPLALAVAGTYNRLGSIDNIDEDANTEQLLAYFQARLADGRLVLSDYYAKRGTDTIEAVLEAFERNVGMLGEKAAALDGRLHPFALVCRQVWDAAVKAGTPFDGTDTERFRELFLDVTVAEEIYRGAVSKVSRPLRELSAVCDFLERRGMAWRVRTEGGAQHYGKEMRSFLADAMHAFADCPEMLKGLDEYEEEVEELLGDA
jgi:hypothetical protein